MWISIILVPLLIWLDAHLFRHYFNFIFEDAEDFHKSVKYIFTPDIFSLFRGKYLEDRYYEFKFGIFMFLCVITIILEIALVRAIINLF